MTGMVIGILVLVGGGVAGAVLHEITHWMTAWLLGRRATIDWRAFETRWEAPAQLSRVDRVIGLAPLSLGIAFGAYVLTSPLLLPLWIWVGWGVYTFNGAASDFSPAPRPDTDTDTDSPSASS